MLTISKYTFETRLPSFETSSPAEAVIGRAARLPSDLGGAAGHHSNEEWNIIIQGENFCTQLSVISQLPCTFQLRRIPQGPVSFPRDELYGQLKLNRHLETETTFFFFFSFFFSFRIILEEPFFFLLLIKKECTIILRLGLFLFFI